MDTIYDLRQKEKALKKIQKTRIELEKKLFKEFKHEFLLEYLRPLSNTDFRTVKLNIEMVNFLIEKKAMSIDTAISRKEIVAIIEPQKKDLQRMFNEYRKFSPITAGVLGFDSKARRTKYFISDINIAKKWLDIMKRLV